MSIRIVCPACRAAYAVPDHQLGKKIRCRECDELIVAAEARPGRPRREEPEGIRSQPRRPTSSRSEKEAAADDDDDRPRSARRHPRPDDEDPPRKSAARRRSRGHLSPLAIFAATFALLVILIAGSVGAYALLRSAPAPKPDGPPQGGLALPPGMEENPLMERRPDLDVHFRAPEEPPTRALTFTEPAAVPPQAPDPDPGPNATGQLTPAVLQRIKEATVYLRVELAQGGAEGSGFFAGAPGFIVTNAHVVGMLGRNAPPPAGVKVVRNKGEKNEITLAAQVVAADPDADLALLSVPIEGLPAPLTIRSAEFLRETQPVYVAGFPLGEVPGKSITINKFELSSLKKEKGVLDKLQVHGDMLPGNSGGPLLDAQGDVVGVCVAILLHTRINFAIPGDKLLRFLDGRLAELTLESPTRAGDELRVPVACRLIDPLGRLPRVALDVWVGKPGPDRPGSRAAPAPQPGDGPHQTLTLDVQQQAARGELVLPPLPAGQVYWLQPSLLGRTGARVWLSAQVYRPAAPVERKPARLAWQPAGDRPFLLERWSVLQHTDPEGHEHRGLLTTEVRWTDTIKGHQGTDVAVYRQFTGLKEGLALDGQVFMTTRLRHAPQNLSFLADELLMDAQGTTKRCDPDSKLKDVAPASKRHLFVLEQDVQKFLQALEVPLPGKEVRPGDTWSARRPLPLDGTWKTLQVLPPEVWAEAENELLDMTYTYEGLRTANGAEQAVIRFRGQAGQQPARGPGTGAPVSGTAVVDLATGQIVEEEVTVQANVELKVFNTVAIKAQSTVVARLRRE